MPYYGDGFPYYYGSTFSNHSSLMTGTPRSLHTPFSRFAPHLSTISESPLSNLRRYSPVTVPTRTRRVVDTADIDVSTPRILTREGNRHRNRLKRDRPTIKIRSQALKDNPALREHNEKHEKTVGELLVEKFLIKDKKADETERKLKMFHQVSLDRDNQQDLQTVKSKITRRFTRRRSSADIQLDPEQLQKEITYAQVQAEVLDNLVAEEQAEIENEVRRGTLIRRSTIGGPKTVPTFFRNNQEEEEEVTSQRMKKTLKKIKKKKKTTEKPSPPDTGDYNWEKRRSSTESEVSMEPKKDDLTSSADENDSLPTHNQMYKIEACNSVGDFSTLWVSTPTTEKRKLSFEQFRESVKIPIPKKINEVEEETEVILPVKKPYIKDTSRISVYCTVKPIQEPMKDSEQPKEASPIGKDLPIVTNGTTTESQKDRINDLDSEKNEAKDARMKKGLIKIPGTKIANISSKDTVSITKKILKDEEKDPKENREESPARKITEVSKPKKDNIKIGTGLKKPEPTKTKPSEPIEKVEEEKILLREDSKAEGHAVVSMARGTSETSASAVPPSNAVCLPKRSKINTDENNAVEAPELSLREAAYLAKPEKSVRDGEDASKQMIKTLSLTESSPSIGSEKSANVESFKNGSLGVSDKSIIQETTFAHEYKSDVPKTLVISEKIPPSQKPKIEDPKLVTKEPTQTVKTEEREIGGDEPKFSFKAAPSIGGTKGEAEKSSNVEVTRIVRNDLNLSKPLKSETEKKISVGDIPDSSKDIKSSTLTNEAKSTKPLESKLPWKSKLPQKTNIDTKTSNIAQIQKPVKDPITLKKADVDSHVNLKESKTLSKIAIGGDEVNISRKVETKSSGQSSHLNESKRNATLVSKVLEPTGPLKKQLLGVIGASSDSGRIIETLEESKEDTGTLSKSASTESIDFWSQIKSPESPQISRNKVPFSFTTPKPVEGEVVSGKLASMKSMKEDDKKKETDLKISTPSSGTLVSNIPVIEEKRKIIVDEVSSTGKTQAEEAAKKLVGGVLTKEKPEPSENSTGKKEPRKKKNLLIQITQTKEPYSSVKKAPTKQEDSSASTTCVNSPASTPDTSVPASEMSTPIAEIPLPIINIMEVPSLSRTVSQNFEEEDNEGTPTPTNEVSDVGLNKISKWSNQNDLSNVDETVKDVTPLASNNVSLTGTPTDSPAGSSKKKKIVKKKKPSTTKKSSTKGSAKSSTKSSTKGSAKNSTKKSEKSEKSSLELPGLKPLDRKSSPKTSPRNTPTQRPLDLIKMFYTTPSALLTATPRDLSKVRRAKIKRKKHQSRTASVSSDSTGSTTSTATTESTDGSGSTCTELDDDNEHKRMNSTRSNDSGFDGSPRISTPSQSSDLQRNSDSSDHFPSGRITPPATNLPRFKKYAVTDFNFLKVLGKGSFGKVLLAELRGTECVYAVKCLKKDVVLEDDDVECTLIERKVLTLATRHPYLCHLFCTFQTDSHLFFVMEYLNGGDLMFHIQKSGRFNEARARFYAAEIWSGLNFLHKKGIVYRDLKLDNVLLDFEGHIRIADFGMCKLQIFLDRTADTFCGTPDYMAPEIIKGLKYNQAVDWWSYGVLLYEMLTGQSPFSGCDEDELFWSICNERPFIPRYLSQESSDMLIALLEKDSGRRLPGHEIAMHPFFQNLPWDRLERRQLDAPFKPALDHTLDTRYFDTAFTAERPRLTPVPEQILSSMDQGVFRGFSYTNPNATD